jgi:hypothetical protein
MSRAIPARRGVLWQLSAWPVRGIQCIRLAHLKHFEEIFKQLEGEGEPRGVATAALDTLAMRYALTNEQKSLLITILREKGFKGD